MESREHRLQLRVLQGEEDVKPFLEVSDTVTVVQPEAAPDLEEIRQSNVYTKSNNNNAYLDNNVYNRKNGVQRKRKMTSGRVAVLGSSSSSSFSSSSYDLGLFEYVLEAPVSIMTTANEEPLAFLNRDQFYSLQLKCSSDSSKLPETVTSVIMVQIDDKEASSATTTTNSGSGGGNLSSNPLSSSVSDSSVMGLWRFWYAKQQSPRCRVIEVDAKNSQGLVGKLNELAHNAVLFRWNPTSICQISLVVRCLSTDFTLQKGVKGIPLLLQIDTYNDAVCGELWDRAFCRIKTFCDKGADRKVREEERRIHKKMAKNPELYYNQQQQSLLNNKSAQKTCLFTHSNDFGTEPILFSPAASASSSAVVNGHPIRSLMVHPEHQQQVSDFEVDSESNKLVKVVQSHGVFDRVMLYARQENEEFYTPFHVRPPSVLGLVRAVCEKYQIETSEVRSLFRKDVRGFYIKMDDDMIRFYTNGDTFTMQVLAVEDNESNRVFYDLIFIDQKDALPQEPHNKKAARVVAKLERINSSGTPPPLIMDTENGDDE